MKASFLFPAAAALVCGLVSLLAGCASSPTRMPVEDLVVPMPIADVDARDFEPPVPTMTTTPAYPIDLRRAGVTGTVQLACVVDESGAVTGAHVLRSSVEGFNAPALEALKSWRFRPARLDGRPVATPLHIPFNFVFTEDE